MTQTSPSAFQILFEDDDIVVINKPPGVVSNAAETTKAYTIQEWMREKLVQTPSTAEWHSLISKDFSDEFGSPEEIFAQRHGLVHRLDKDTSGAMVLAKNPGALVELLRQFREREVSKSYVALVHGKVWPPKATLTLPMGRATHDRQRFAVTAEGRPAITEYEVQQFYTGLDEEKMLEQLSEVDESERKAIKKRLHIYQGFSLVRCVPKTGRTHQIRVHMAHIKHPLVGDATYVGRKRAALDPLWCSRQFLHAEKLEFVHPRTKQTVSFEALPGEDLRVVLGLLIQEN